MKGTVKVLEIKCEQAFYTKTEQLQDELNRKKHYKVSLVINKFIECVVNSLAVVNEFGFGRYSVDVLNDGSVFEIVIEIDGDIWGGNKRYKISINEISKIFGERASRRVFHYYQGYVSKFVTVTHTVKCDVIEIDGDFQLFVDVVERCDEICNLKVKKFIKKSKVIDLLQNAIDLFKQDSA